MEKEERAGSGSPTIASTGSESPAIALCRETRGKFSNIALHFTIENQMRWNHYGRVRKREGKVRKAGNPNPLSPFPCTEKVRRLSEAFVQGSVVFSSDFFKRHR